ncbi:MAG TPA: putative O-glycosylation ligase, exosortase A system-associated [Candidatus Acidoferrum sp.]|jgi:probable O-glycosylation ligase (exosortase A-associated)
MRDVLVLAIIVGSIPICFIRPFFGAMMWVWVAYFNPHRFTYGFAYDFPVSTVIAIPTLLGLLFFRKVNRGVFVRETVMLMIFWAWIIITYINATQVPIFADHIDDAQLKLIEVSKVLIMTFVLILVVTSKKRLEILLLVTAFSFGALAIKGTLFGFETGGNFRIWGPPDSFVYDNNDLGLALNMTIPVMYYLTREVESPRLRKLLWVCFYSSILTVILSYSRGALLGLTVVLSAIALKSKRKMLAAGLLAVFAVLILTFAPAAWMDRMGNFAHGELDESAEGRLHAWEFALVFASQYPIMGGGFETFTPQLEARFTPQYSFAGPHSIYFQTLGEQGYVGLGIFLFVLGGTFFGLWSMRRRVRGQPAFPWIDNYSNMLQICLLGYVVSGAFLPRAYFDLWFQLVASAALLKILYKQELSSLATAQAEAPVEADLVEAPAG